jgi:hypothetical protein
MNKNIKPSGYWTKEKCHEEALKYNTKVEFIKNCGSARCSAIKNGWYDEICSHMIKIVKPVGYWTKEKCAEEASKYTKKIDFQRKCGSAYNSALSHGWIDKICSHMENRKKPDHYWTKELCLIESLKYDIRNVFGKNSKAAYVAACKSGWLEEICSHMIPQGNKTRRYVYIVEFTDNHAYVGISSSIDRRIKEHFTKDKDNSQVFKHYENHCKEYNVKNIGLYPADEVGKFENFYISEYRSNGWKVLNKAKGGALGSNNIKWTKEKCAQEALKYKTRGEFQNNSLAYNPASKNKWLDEICSHMIEIKKPNGYWTYERCKKEALKYINKDDLKINSPSAYSKALKNKWYDITQHMEQIRLRHYWTEERCINAAKSCENKTEFHKKYLTAYVKLKNLKIFDTVCLHMKDARSNESRRKWNFDTCAKEALKYKTRGEFQKNSGSAYTIACKNNWLDEICEYMTSPQKPSGYYTIEICREEASKYTKKKEFCEKCRRTYDAAYRNGWLNEICSHMK